MEVSRSENDLGIRVAADQGEALAARASAYGDADLSLLNGGSSQSLPRDPVKRLDLLLAETSWGYPQPPPPPSCRGRGAGAACRAGGGGERRAR